MFADVTSTLVSIIVRIKIHNTGIVHKNGVHIHKSIMVQSKCYLVTTIGLQELIVLEVIQNVKIVLMLKIDTQIIILEKHAPLMQVKGSMR